MLYGGFYEIGTASLDGVDDDIVNIVGALLLDNIVPEDTWEYAGRRVSIVEVISDSKIRLKYDWPDSSFSSVAGGTWVIRKDSPLRNPAVAQARTLRDQYERLRIFDQSKPILGLVEFGVNSPPVDYSVNDALVVGPTPTGEFVGRSDKIARYTEEGSWFYITPDNGWHVISDTDPIGQSVVRSWNGTEWLPTSGLSAGLNFRGEWSVSEDYVNGDVVLRSFKLFVVEGNSTGDDPLSGSPWHVYVLPGEHGGNPIRVAFDTDVTATEPAPGKAKLNNAIPGNASILRISKTDRFGGNQSAEIAWIGISNISNQKGRIRLQKIGSKEDFRCIVMTVTDAGTSYNLTISSPSAPNGFFNADDELLFYFDWRGEKGEKGDKGDIGLRGPTGGPFEIAYTIDANSVADTDPTPGGLRFGSIPQFSATVLRADILGSDLASVSVLLDAINSGSTSAVKAKGRIFKTSDLTKYLNFDIMSVASPSGYRNITIVPTGGNGEANPFAHNDAVILTWLPTGDKGNAGTIAVGTVSTGVPGSNVQVTNVGTPSSGVLNFIIPRGDKGDNFQPTYVVGLIAGRSTYDAGNGGSVFDANGHRISVLVLSDSGNGNLPTLYFLMVADTGGGATWSSGTTFGVVAQDASNINFDGTDSGLAATDVQGAIDEVVERSNSGIDPITAAIIFGA